MANRRMFSKTITNSSRFLMMPQSAQNLYFHFGMNADDDGFCEHFTIMRMTESKPDDLRILRAKRLVEIFDDKVLVILDWKENNYIRSDRYEPSKYLDIYKEEIKLLVQNKGEIENDVVGIPNGNQRDTQYRLGKDNTYSVDFEEFWKEYPRKVGKGKAFESWKKAKNKPSLEVILEVLKKQKRCQQWQKDDGQYIPHPTTWLNQCRWDDEVEEDNEIEKIWNSSNKKS